MAGTLPVLTGIAFNSQSSATIGWAVGNAGIMLKAQVAKNATSTFAPSSTWSQVANPASAASPALDIFGIVWCVRHCALNLRVCRERG